MALLGSVSQKRKIMPFQKVGIWSVGRVQISKSKGHFQNRNCSWRLFERTIKIRFEMIQQNFRIVLFRESVNGKIAIDAKVEDVFDI